MSTGIRQLALSAAANNRTFASLAVPFYARLWLVGLFAMIGAWTSTFLCAYLVNQLTHSPFLVQLISACYFLPMFFGGVIGGTISDRLDRRRALLTMQSLLVPLALGMAALNISGAIDVWMVGPFLLCIGIGQVTDMTCRRSLVYDVVGPERVTNSQALEAMGGTTGAVVSGLAGGSVINAVGVGPAFLLAGCAYALAFTVLRTVPTVARTRQGGAPPRVSVLRDFTSAFSLLRGNPALISILAVTVLMNLCYFPFIPMIPVYADHLGVNAFWTGVLAAGPPIGSVVGASFIARGPRLGRGRIFTYGSTTALACLAAFSFSGSYPLALAALMLAGFGLSGYMTMQIVLVMVTASDRTRGRALGLMSMTIGILPFSMVAVGAIAQAVGAERAAQVATLVGICCIVLLTRRVPASIRID